MRQSPVRGQKMLDRPFLIAACLAGATLAVYLRAIPQGFVHIDDPVYVTGNSHVLTGFSFQNLRWSFVGFHGGNWFPLTWLSLMLDAEIFGDQAAGYHFTNVALHVANTRAAFRPARTSDRQSRQECICRGPLRIASSSRGIGCLDFRTKGRAERFLWTPLAVGVRSIHEASQVGTLGGSILLFLCSLMSKQTLVTLPFLLLPPRLLAAQAVRRMAKTAVPRTFGGLCWRKSRFSPCRLCFARSPFSRSGRRSDR